MYMKIFIEQRRLYQIWFLKLFVKYNIMFKFVFSYMLHITKGNKRNTLVLKLIKLLFFQISHTRILLTCPWASWWVLPEWDSRRPCCWVAGWQVWDCCPGTPPGCHGNRYCRIRPRNAASPGPAHTGPWRKAPDIGNIETGYILFIGEYPANKQFYLIHWINKKFPCYTFSSITKPYD